MLMGWVAAANGAPAAVVEEPSARPGKATSAPAVAVKDAEPVWLVFLDHDGPYWTVGPLFARVRAYMLEHDQSGPMFVRYNGNPWRDGRSSLGAKIGFITQENDQPEPPFKIVKRDRERVAYIIVKSRATTRRRDYAFIHEWIRAHGFDAAGAVTEIYRPGSPGGRTSQQRTEIQVSLVGADHEHPRDEDSGGPPIAVTTTEESTAATTGELSGAVTLESKSSPAHRSVTGTQATIAEPLPSPFHKASTPNRKNVGLPGKAEPVLPVSELMAAGRFERIAEQLMPDQSAIPASLQVWLGQVVLRIGAAARGIEHVYPGNEPRMRRLADAVTRRYKEVSAGFEFDPLYEPVVNIDVRNDPLRRNKQSLMHELDMLLGRIALRSVDAKTAVEELTAIVQRVQELTTAHDTGVPEPASP